MAGNHRSQQSCDIFYFQTLNFTYKSGQTIQVVKDYYYLSNYGYNTHIYGIYSDKRDLEDVRGDCEGALSLYYRNDSLSGRFSIKLKLLKDIILHNRFKLIVVRHYRKAKKIVSLKPFLKNKRIILEMHEDAIPHLVKGEEGLKTRFLQVVQQIDGVVFTNFSQRKIFLGEFGYLPPKSIVLPNGVEVDRFKKAKRGNNFVITYVGQFTWWKNVELLFKALTYLDKRYRLRIAGGKGDDESKGFIEELTRRYHLDGRVDYMGFVRHQEVVERVLNGSSVLVLPLGDNIQSRYLTSPMKLFEYMATPIPVVAVNYPSINMIASHEEVYLADNDPVDFAEKIKEASNENARERIERMNILAEKYDYKRRAERYHNFIVEAFLKT